MTKPRKSEAVIWTIVVAAGTGSRYGGMVPKQFVELAGRRVVDWAVVAAAAVSDGVVVVVPPDHPFEPPEVGSSRIVVVPGGASRSASVRCGLAALPGGVEIVLVHDAARPIASEELFARVVGAVLEGADAVIPTIPVVDTLRALDGRAVDRSSFEAVQTPQGFSFRAIVEAHAGDPEATDDATLVQRCGGRVIRVAGERWNMKLTESSDERVAAALLRERR